MTMGRLYTPNWGGRLYTPKSHSQERGGKPWLPILPTGPHPQGGGGGTMTVGGDYLQDPPKSHIRRGEGEPWPWGGGGGPRTCNIYIYMCKHTHIYIYACKLIYTCMDIYIYKYLCVYTCAYVYIHICVRVCVWNFWTEVKPLLFLLFQLSLFDFCTIGAIWDCGERTTTDLFLGTSYTGSSWLVNPMCSPPLMRNIYLNCCFCTTEAFHCKIR